MIFHVHAIINVGVASAINSWDNVEWETDLAVKAVMNQAYFALIIKQPLPKQSQLKIDARKFNACVISNVLPGYIAIISQSNALRERERIYLAMKQMLSAILIPKLR